MAEIQCIHCKSSNLRIVYPAQDGRDSDIQIYKCNTCGKFTSVPRATWQQATETKDKH